MDYGSVLGYFISTNGVLVTGQTKLPDQLNDNNLTTIEKIKGVALYPPAIYSVIIGTTLFVLDKFS